MQLSSSGPQQLSRYKSNFLPAQFPTSQRYNAVQASGLSWPRPCQRECHLTISLRPNLKLQINFCRSNSPRQSTTHPLALPPIRLPASLISTPLIIPHDNHGHDHDRHDISKLHPTYGPLSKQTTPLVFTQAVTQRNQNNPLPMTSDLSNCQTKHWNTQKLVTCGGLLPGSEQMCLRTDTSRLDTWRLE